MDLKEFITGDKGKNIPTDLKGFNWGAFLLTFIWGIRFRAWLTLLAIPLIWYQLPFGINWLLLTALQIYCGIKGNDWAYQVEWWKKPKDFRATQIKWAIGAFAIHLIIPFLLISITLRFLQKSPENPINFMQNSICAVSYNKIKKGLPKTPISGAATDEQIALSFAKQFNNTQTQHNKVYILHKSNGFSSKLFAITFSKHGQNCSLTELNCEIQTSLVIADELSSIGECRFYFDNNKNIIPSKRTKSVLEKGYNIFKYL